MNSNDVSNFIKNLPQEQLKQVLRMKKQYNDALKEMFKGEIRGKFLIDIKEHIILLLDTDLFNLYDYFPSVEKSLVGMGSFYDYEISKVIIGCHHANTIFLNDREIMEKTRNEEYKKEVAFQSCLEIYLRRYGAAFFRNKSIMIGERFIYYPVPYMLFYFCIRMNEIFLTKEAINEESFLDSMIMNKALAALSLVEGGFLDSAYLPCRTVIELYIKLLVLRTDKKLFGIANSFACYDWDKTNLSNQYSDEFNSLFANRKRKNFHNKVEYLHYGFVDFIDNYHEIVKQNPYSINGMISYLNSFSDEETCQKLDLLQKLHLICHGYTHGNFTRTQYPVLHYLEISMILGLIIPDVYTAVCEAADVDKPEEPETDPLNLFNKHFNLTKEQYFSKDDEKLKLESEKYTYR